MWRRAPAETKRLCRGGGGRDRVKARGGGRNVVRCGKGRDKAVVDRRDRVRGCEKVRRRK
jgi:hypothetical protein